MQAKLCNEGEDALSSLVKQQPRWCKVNEQATMVNRNRQMVDGVRLCMPPPGVILTLPPQFVL